MSAAAPLVSAHVQPPPQQRRCRASKGGKGQQDRVVVLDFLYESVARRWLLQIHLPAPPPRPVSDDIAIGAPPCADHPSTGYSGGPCQQVSRSYLPATTLLNGDRRHICRLSVPSALATHDLIFSRQDAAARHQLHCRSPRPSVPDRSLKNAAEICFASDAARYPSSPPSAGFPALFKLLPATQRGERQPPPIQSASFTCGGC